MTQSMIARAVCGAVLATVIACGDSPTGTIASSNPSNPPSATNIAGFSVVPNFLAGESVLHRAVVLPDGRRVVVDGVRGADGLPRDLQLSQEGVVVARLRNSWRVVGDRAVLERQQVVRYRNGDVAGAFDSRDHGGVESVAGGTITMPTAAVVDASGVSGITRKATPFSDYGDYYYAGPCDALARAVEGALDNWLTACIGMAVGTSTGNPIIAYSAWAVQFKAWRDVVRAEAALDDCVANAGRPPEW